MVDKWHHLKTCTSSTYYFLIDFLEQCCRIRKAFCVFWRRASMSECILLKIVSFARQALFFCPVSSPSRRLVWPGRFAFLRIRRLSVQLLDALVFLFFFFFDGEAHREAPPAAIHNLYRYVLYIGPIDVKYKPNDRRSEVYCRRGKNPLNVLSVPKEYRGKKTRKLVKLFVWRRIY